MWEKDSAAHQKGYNRAIRNPLLGRLGTNSARYRLRGICAGFAQDWKVRLENDSKVTQKRQTYAGVDHRTDRRG